MSLQAGGALRDPEILALVGDDPSLLAIVDAIHCTQPARRRQLQLRLTPLLACTVAAVAVVVSLVAPWQTSPGLVSRALAAVGQQAVVHIVSAQPLKGVSILDLNTGKLDTASIRTEVFFDAGRKLERSISTSPLAGVSDELHTGSGDWINGVPVWTCARIAAHPAAAARARVSCAAGASTRPQPPQLDPALAEFTTGYRSALASGKARHVSDRTLNGRPVHWLAIGPNERVAVDARTLLPVLVRRTEHKIVSSYRVLSFTTGPYQPTDFAKAKPPAIPPAGGESVHGTGPISLARARAVIGNALLLPRHVTGLRFESARLVNLLTGYNGERPARHSQAVDLLYRRGNQQLVLQESRQPDLIAGFTGNPVDPGHALIRQNGVSNISLADEQHWAQAGILIARWRALLDTNGVYVTIDSWSKPLLLDAAANLSTMRP
ncbi:MAG TPA: hypothetical protein VGL76_08065 [Gaiellaceae bacterium]